MQYLLMVTPAFLWTIEIYLGMSAALHFLEAAAKCNDPAKGLIEIIIKKRIE